jgi:prepilin-type N-terminal cleavage/methylation domain-containing protein
MSRQKGFTLIELLIVIAIIGVLSSIILSVTQNARTSSRDTRRIADFRQFITALDLFYDKYGVYPCGDADTSGGMTHDSSGSVPFIDGTGGLSVSNCIGNPKFGLATDGLIPTSFAQDPINTGTFPSQLYWYQVPSNRQSYILYVRLEGNPNKTAGDGGLCPNLYEVGPGKGIITPIGWQIEC